VTVSARLLIVGDDFTPARLFHAAIQRRGLHDRFHVVEVDLHGEYDSGPRDGVREFVGRPEEYVPSLRGAQVLLTTFAPVTRRALDDVPDLRLIVVGRGGPVNVDVAAAAEREITVAFAPGRNADAVAEYTLGLILALTRRIPTASRWVREGQWTSGREDTLDKPTGPELAGRTLGIIGLGAIGAKVAHLAGAFGMTVLGHDPFLTEGRSDDPPLVPLEDLLRRSDVVTVHARPAIDGRPILGLAELAALRDGTYLVNTSRGANIDHDALRQQVASGRLGGVALDVLDHEPIDPSDPLLRSDDVLITPHAAGVSLDIPGRTAELVVDRLEEWLTDGRPRFVVEPAAAPS
jgi:D-3-phosphoglycerate dehydrogenase